MTNCLKLKKYRPIFIIELNTREQMSPEKRMETPDQERNRQENPDEVILRYIGKPLESIGMLPARSNSKNCGMLFQGDSVLSSGTYFA